MRDRDIEKRATLSGLQIRWRDAFGHERRVSAETLRALLDTMDLRGEGSDRGIRNFAVTFAARPSVELPDKIRGKVIRVELEQGGVIDFARGDSSTRIALKRPLPPGYHTLHFDDRRMTLAAAPQRCFSINDIAGSDARLWGLAAQIYSLRGEADLGFGNFGALKQLVVQSSARGASAIALSPTHAMFYADPRRFSPYSPSNRAWLNALFADACVVVSVRDFPEMIEHARLADELRSVRASRLIDWLRSAALHRTLFEGLFARFRAGKLAGAASFEAFVANGGASLLNHARFEALDERHPGAPKPALDSAACRTQSHTLEDRIRFHIFLQWCAARGLESAQAAARAADMPIGLIADLAVGVDPSGSECWSHPRNMLIGATIGAPPDQLNAIGQNWGLTTFSPRALVSAGYGPFLDILRATMQHAGGVRLDHVMSLMRLWMIPRGAAPIDGAYLAYPFDDLVRLIALESWRNRCIVIGEDLGTVPDAIRTQLADAGILGLDVLPFMRDGRAFVPPQKWRTGAVAMTSTHDVAPVAGWWHARDLEWRRQLELFGDVGKQPTREERDDSRQYFARAMSRATGAKLTTRSSSDRVVDAAIDFVATSASPLAIVPLEDFTGAIEQPNLPGTTDEHPNWRRRYAGGAKAILSRAHTLSRMRRLRRQRKPAP